MRFLLLLLSSLGCHWIYCVLRPCPATATNKGARKPSIYHGVCCFSRGKQFSFHQQCPYPVTKRHKPMLFPTALLLIIFMRYLPGGFVQTQNFFGSTSLAFEYNSTDDYRILKGANSISFRSTVRVCQRNLDHPLRNGSRSFL